MIEEELFMNMVRDSIQDDLLIKFAIESNNIEGIFDDEKHREHADSLKTFLNLPKINVSDLVDFVSKIQPNARLRQKHGDNVWIGGKSAQDPITVAKSLDKVLYQINGDMISPFVSHQHYEKIHPFTDGNGRSGRALWLWQMMKFHNYNLKCLFLRMYYYQTFTFFRDNYEE